METSEIIWTGSPDDMTARSGEYELQCEKTGSRTWWWCCYFQEEIMQSDIIVGEAEAKAAAINAMNEHLKKK